MAQAGSAQREPSMEEILASIRRIIEDSDTVRKPYDEIAQDPPEPEMASEPAGRDVVLDRKEGAVIEVDAFRAELRGAHAAPEPRKPVTLAEVQAQIAAEARKRAEREGRAVSVEQAPEVEPVRETPSVAPAPIEPEWASASASYEGPAAGEQEALRDDAFDAVFNDITAEQAAHATMAAETTESARPAVAESAFAKPAIISEHAGRQVAAAFGELSEAFAQRGKKTFDEMAEEMMRPMLQDWLDNNLPTLVERLVREEIERVARGAQ